MGGGSNAPPQFFEGGGAPPQKGAQPPFGLEISICILPSRLWSLAAGPETQSYLPRRAWRKWPAPPRINEGGLSPPSVLHLALPHMERFRRLWFNLPPTLPWILTLNCLYNRLKKRKFKKRTDFWWLYKAAPLFLNCLCCCLRFRTFRLDISPIMVMMT